MSEATPMPAEPPLPSAQQLAPWRALIERIRQGDRSQVVAWDEAAAAGPAATYQVLVTHRVRRQLGDAPPFLVGYVAGIIAVLRVDPTQASMIFRRHRLGDVGWTVAFGAAQGLLTYGLVQPEQLVVLLDPALGWMTDHSEWHASSGWQDSPRGQGDGKHRLIASRHAGAVGVDKRWTSFSAGAGTLGA